MATLNEWLSIDKTSGTGNAYVTLTASSYQEMQDRTASLSVKTESEEVMMTVIQKAFNGAFWITKNLISSEWEGGDFTTEIFSAYASLWWSQPDWATAKTTINGNKRTVTITIQPNLTEEIRTGKIVFKASSNGSVLGEITLVQSISAEENNIIFYTSTNGSAITPYSTTGLISNTYENGVGMLYYGETVTKIPDNLFRSKTDLQSISMPPSVTEIGEYAFYQCTNLSSVDFSENITTINRYVFYRCTALKNISTPSKVKSLGDYCFYSCSLSSITLNEGIESIGSYCLSYNDFTEIVIPDSYTGDLTNVLRECSKLTNVTLSQNMTSIGEGAFYNDKLITSITIPSKITSIGKQSFYNCPIVDIHFEDRDALLTIQSDSFQNNSSFFNAYVPNLRSWLYVQAQRLTNPSSGGVRNLYVDGELLTEFVSPLDFNGTIQPYAFYKNPHIISVYLGECTVSNYSFNGLSNCSHLVLGTDCKLDGGVVFSEIEGVLEVYCDEVYYNTFSNCSFQKVILDCDGGTFAANGLKTKELIVNGNRQAIRGFSNSKSILDTVSFNGTNIDIGDSCFDECSLIRELDFTKVGFIGNYAFRGTNITEIKGLEHCVSIGYCAFQDSSLTYAELYENGITLGEVIFNATDLRHIKIVRPNEKVYQKSYAFVGGNTVFNTKVKTHKNLKLDFWWKNNASHTGDGWYVIFGAEDYSGSQWGMELTYNSSSTNTLYFRIAHSAWTFDITSASWQHFVITNKGLWLNGERKVSYGGYGFLDGGDKELYINGVDYNLGRNANGEFSTFTIDDVDFIPTENGFINSSTNELLENVGSDFNYTYEGVIEVVDKITKPTISNRTFVGVPQYGFLEYPKNNSYSDWLSTSSYYLGYYKWNNITIPTDTLDFGVQDSYEITIVNNIPNNWEITSKPFWVDASVMSGGEGTTTVTFTKTCDYVEDGNIVITIMGVNYVIPAKAPYIVFDLTEENNFTANVTINGLSSKTYTINNGDTWDSFVIDGDNIIITKIGDLYTTMTMRRTITTTDGEQYVIRYKCDGNAPLPKADNRIYYTGSIDTNSPKNIYGTNADYVTSGYYGGGVYYIEYDRPILWLTYNFGNESDIERISLPSSLQYIDDNCLRDCPNLMDVSFGGDEKYIGSYSFYNCPKLTEITFGGEMEIINSGAFNNLTTANFLGMTPPRIISGFNENCSFYAPIGSDYSSIPYSVEYTLEGIERNRGDESHWLDGNQVNLFIPETEAKILFYDATTEECSMISLGYTPKNTSDTYLSLSYTKNEENLTTYYQVRNGSAECMIEAIRTYRSNIIQDNIVFVIRVNTFKGISFAQFAEGYLGEYSSVPTCLLNGMNTNVYVYSVGEYDVSFRAMGALAPPSCITIKYKDTYGRELYNKYNFIRAEYRYESGVRPSLTKWYVDGYMTYK